MCDAEIDWSYAHREHRICHWSEDTRHPGLWVPQNKGKIKGQSDTTRNNHAVDNFFHTIVAQNHDGIEREKEPCYLFARESHTQEAGGTPTFVAQEPDQHNKQSIEDVKITTYS